MTALAGISGPKSTCLGSTGRSPWLSGYSRANCMAHANIEEVIAEVQSRQQRESRRESAGPAPASQC